MPLAIDLAGLGLESRIAGTAWRGRDRAAEVSRDEGEGPVGEVAEVADELAVHLLLEIGPGESGVASLGPVVEDIESPDVRGDAGLDGVGPEDADSLGLGELAATRS